jgi:hypothetical protein
VHTVIYAPYSRSGAEIQNPFCAVFLGTEADLVVEGQSEDMMLQIQTVNLRLRKVSPITACRKREVVDTASFGRKYSV